MINNINDNKNYQFNDNAILIVEQSEKMFLLGPQLEDIEQLSAPEAFVFYLLKELRKFKVSDILSKFCAQQGTSRPQDPIFILKVLNKFINKTLVSPIDSGEDNLKKGYPQFEIRYHFGRSQREAQELVARTYPNKVAYHWALALNYQLKYAPELFHNGIFYGNCFNSIDYCFDTIRNLIPLIDRSLKKYLDTGGDKLIWPEIKQDREYLWKLHQVFEEYYPKTLAKEVFNYNEEISQLGQNLKLLNYLIHMAEDALEKWMGGFVEVIFDNHTKPTPLGSDEYIDSLFSPDFEENTIYLNYFQIGYSVLAAYDAGTDSSPVPQKDFCANHFIYLRPQNKLTEQKRDDLDKWLSEKHERSINDPSLRLGHIPLAKLQGNKGYEEITQNLASSKHIRSLEIKLIS